MDYEPRTIRSFVYLAESLSFTKTAAQLGVTQPHLSTRIKGLEQQLGFALFSRTSRRVQITPGGLQFLEAAKSYLLEAEKLERVGLSVRRGRATSITVGTGGCHAEVRWFLLGKFIELYPHIELSIRTFQNSAEIWSGLRSGEVDVALVVPPVPDEFDYQTISSAKAGLIMRSDIPMARHEVVSPDLLNGQQIAIFPRRIFPTLYDNVVAGLREFGPWFSELPEPGMACMSSFIRATGVPVLGAPWWRSEEERPSDVAYRDIAGHPIPLNSVLARLRTRSTEAATLLWNLGASLGADARRRDRFTVPAGVVAQQPRPATATMADH